MEKKLELRDLESKPAVNLNKDVENWWDKNPFTYNNHDGVGKPQQEVDLEFFNTVDRKLRKHAPTYQSPLNGPLLSAFINFSALKGKKVLDIATGTGLVTVEFSKAGADIVGIDITNQAVEFAKKNLKLRDLSGTVLKMDAQAMSFKDSEFDFVCAHGCLMHMPNTQKAVDEIFRVLKPQGKVHVWMYHKGWYFWFGIIFLRGVLFGQFLFRDFSILKLTSAYTDGARLGGNPHTKFHSQKEAKRYFINSGFRNVNSYVVYNPVEFDSWPIAKLPLGRFIPNPLKAFLGKFWGLGVVVSAEKP